MKRELAEATILIARLNELASQGTRAGDPSVQRRGDEVAINQLAVFGELLVVLARYMDRAQRTIKQLTCVLVALTALLAVDVLPRLLPDFETLLQLLQLR